MAFKSLTICVSIPVIYSSRHNVVCANIQILAIAVACRDQDVRAVRALIVGPPDSPYEFGFFEVGTHTTVINVTVSRLTNI